MSEARASYIRDRRLIGNDILRRLVAAGNILAHRHQTYIAECTSLGVPEVANEEVDALELWEAALAALRGEVAP